MLFLTYLYVQGGAQTHHPEIKTHMLYGLSQADAPIPEFLPDFLMPFLSIGRGGGVQALDICPQIKDEGGAILGQKSLDLILATLSTPHFFLFPLSSKKQGPCLLEGGGIRGTKAEGLLGPWDFLLLSVLGPPLDLLTTPASVSDSASTSGGHRPVVEGKGPFCLSQGSLGPYQGERS